MRKGEKVHSARFGLGGGPPASKFSDYLVLHRCGNLMDLASTNNIIHRVSPILPSTLLAVTLARVGCWSTFF